MLDIILIAVGSAASPRHRLRLRLRPAVRSNTMLIDYILGGRRDARPAGLSRLRAAAPRALLRNISMTVNGWLQIALFCAIVIALAKPFGGYMTRVFTGERTFLSPVLRPVERVVLSAVRRRREARAALGRLRRRDAAVQPRRLRSASTRCSACRRVLPFNPAGQSAVEPEPRLQHVGQLHHQHQLAVLRAARRR